MDNNKSIIQLTEAVEAIKTAILQGQYEALKDVNRVQLAVYFAIGKYLLTNTSRLPYGSGALKAISEQLRKEMPGLRGFSATQLKEMRIFYKKWEILDCNWSVTTDQFGNENSEVGKDEFAPATKKSVTTDQFINSNSAVMTAESQDSQNQIDIYHAITIPNVAEFPVEDFFKVPFTHHTRILALSKSMPERYYYIRRTAEEHLSVEALEKLLKQKAFENQVEMPNNFTKTIPNSAIARKAVMMFKDSYALQFINTEEIGERDKEDIDERVVEQKIIHNIKKFIMTFGNDFAFVGNQYHLEVYNEEFFPDLIFFNRELNSLVVIELKTGKFTPSYLGQLTTYLQILDDKVRKPHENPSIGIVLCKTANKAFVEYVIQKYDSPMGVATYTTAADMPENLRKALPDMEDLKKLISDEDNADV